MSLASVHRSSLTPVGQNRAGEEEDQGDEVEESLRGRDDMDMSSATHEVEEAGAEALMSIDEGDLFRSPCAMISLMIIGLAVQLSPSVLQLRQS